MARQINKLNARKMPESVGLHSDGNGLYLKVHKGGSRSWVLIYNFNKKRREKGLGPYPAVSLADARNKAREFQSMIASGVDPLAKGGDVTFGQVATELIESLKPGWKNEKHGNQWRNTLETHAKSIWSLPVAEVTTDLVVNLLQDIWVELPETASRVRARIERVLDAAKVRGLKDGDNPARWKGHLEVILPKRVIKARNHHPALPYEDVRAFINELRQRPALAARALEFLILTAARTSEVIGASREEFDLDARLWTVPASRMKAGKEHRVPLVERAVEIIRHVDFLGHERPFKMSNMAMENLLRRMDRNDITVHGFRSSFRDWVGEETDFPRELAEAALAHQVGDAVERAYRRGDALAKRRELMEVWSRYVSPENS